MEAAKRLGDLNLAGAGSVRSTVVVPPPEPKATLGFGIAGLGVAAVAACGVVRIQLRAPLPLRRHPSLSDSRYACQAYLRAGKPAKARNAACSESTTREAAAADKEAKHTAPISVDVDAGRTDLPGADPKAGDEDKILTPPSEPADLASTTTALSDRQSADAAELERAMQAASEEAGQLSERIREARANSLGGPRPSIEDVAAECRGRKCSWKDAEFGHDAAHVFRDWPAGLDKGAVTWEPPSRYCATRRPVGKTRDGKRTWLYCDSNGDGIASAAEAMKASEIEQGAIGDCYLLSALATAVKDLQVADDLIDETYEDAGIYGVSLWLDGRWRMVWVDACVPCVVREMQLPAGKGTGRGRAVKRFRPLFARLKDTKEIWTLLVEKAYAKVKGSYEAIVGGHPGEALAMLTGGKAGFTSIISQESHLLPRPTTEFVWQTLVSKLSGASDPGAGCFVGAGSVRPSARNAKAQENFLKGIVPGHAYSVLDAVEVKLAAAGEHSEEEDQETAPATGPHRLVRLRNPWGHGEWEGKWADRCDAWKTPAGRELAAQLGARRGDNDDDGSFWMHLSDFTLRFATLEWCRATKSAEEMARARRLAIVTDEGDSPEEDEEESGEGQKPPSRSPKKKGSPRRKGKRGRGKRKGY